MQDIGKEIADKYNLDIKNIFPYKDSYILNTNMGKRVMKRSTLSPERIMFIHGVKEYLFQNNFKNTDRYICNIDGNPFITINGSIHTLSEIIEGNECNFDNKADILKATELLANFHKASRGYKPAGNCVIRDDLGKLPIYFSKRLDELKKLKKVARKGKTKFDYLFLEHIDYFYNLGENALQLIESSEYYKLSENTRNIGMLCHHDFAHHNIICAENKVSLINFDYCCFELKVYDIANFLRRKMRKCDWEVKEAQVIISKYNSIETISKEDFMVLQIIMQFPQKFWRVVNKYYNSRHSWSEKSYIARLQEVIDEIPFHKNFIERFEPPY